MFPGSVYMQLGPLLKELTIFPMSALTQAIRSTAQANDSPVQVNQSAVKANQSNI